MAEGVRVDVGQAVAAGEVIEPIGDAVRVHVIAVILSEHIAGRNPPVTIGQLEPKLFPLVLPEQLHGFIGQREQTAVAGLRFALIHALLLV